MIRAALWTNHLSDLPQLVDVQKSTSPVGLKFSFLLLLFLFLLQPPLLLPLLCPFNHIGYRLYDFSPTYDAVFAEQKLLFLSPLFS